MDINEALVHVFNNFHDGTVSNWKGDMKILTLTIDCQYLATRIDKSYNKFYVKLHDIIHLEFDPWYNRDDIHNIILKDLSKIFIAKLEILGAELTNGIVVINFSLFSSDFNFTGGNLALICKKVSVFDESNKELSINQLNELSKNYWNQYDHE